MRPRDVGEAGFIFGEHVQRWDSSRCGSGNQPISFRPLPSLRIVVTSDYWIEDGWNVGIFYWNQFADDELLAGAEAKIYTPNVCSERDERCIGTRANCKWSIRKGLRATKIHFGARHGGVPVPIHLWNCAYTAGLWPHLLIVGRLPGSTCFGDLGCGLWDPLFLAGVLSTPRMPCVPGCAKELPCPVRWGHYVYCVPWLLKGL